MDRNSVCAYFAIAAATAAYFISYSIWITVCVFFVALTIAMSLRPNLDKFFSKKKSSAFVSVLTERGFEAGAPEDRIFYVLIMTQAILMSPADPEQKAALEDIFNRSVAALSDGSDLFKRRYDSVQAEALPQKICVGTCGEKRSSIATCYREWQKAVNLEKNFHGMENTNLFFHDLQFTDPLSKTEHSAVTAVVFFNW